jgi:hypothetical protein
MCIYMYIASNSSLEIDPRVSSIGGTFPPPKACCQWGGHMLKFVSFAFFMVSLNYVQKKPYFESFQWLFSEDLQACFKRNHTLNLVYCMVRY